jgi:hypothetical protein
MYFSTEVIIAIGVVLGSILPYYLSISFVVVFLLPEISKAIGSW